MGTAADSAELADDSAQAQSGAQAPGTRHARSEGRRVTQDMMDLNPEVDVTMPGLIDYVITDLGSPLSPTSVSQYIVAQFAT
jgi:translation initiation factor eIF-2B subunit alpha